MCNKLIVREFFVLSSRLQRYDIYARWVLQSYKKLLGLKNFLFTLQFYHIFYPVSFSCIKRIHP